MNTENYEKRLEREIGRVLKALPELTAPPTLAPRVLAALARTSAISWRRRAWQSWPFPLRLLALSFLLAIFGTLCYGAWAVTQPAELAHGAQMFSGIKTVAGMCLSTLGTLAAAVQVIVQYIGYRFVLAGLVLILLGYTACVALSAGCVRLACARQNEFRL